jgi:DNA-binding response OmpR family regulator
MNGACHRTPPEAGGARGSRRRILVAEDDPEVRDLVADTLRNEGHDVVEVPDGHQLVAALVQARVEGHLPNRAVDLIVTDVRMPGPSGIHVVELLRASEWRTPVIIMTSFGDSEMETRARRLDAVFLGKPFGIDSLTTAVQLLLG